jgi:ABC-type dipeptide/oligopeptide/nickel transport system permease component
MVRYLARKAAHALLVLGGVSIVVFFLLHLIPGDPATTLLSEHATPETVRALRQQLGLDEPLPVQYAKYVLSCLRGDLGKSIRYGIPTLDLVLKHLPATIELALAAVAITILVALPASLVSALRRDSSFDYLLRLGALLGQSIPGYWLGMILILVLAVQARLLPTSGRGTLAHLLMPSVTLAAYFVALLARMTRSVLLEVLEEDYVRTARAKGLARRAVVVRHALANALIPVATLLGLQIGTLLGGAVITEAVFAWPGIGSLAIQAIFNRDYPLVQAIVLISAVIFVIINYCLDAIYCLLDPRIRLAE